MSGQLTFDDRTTGKEKTVNQRNHDAARSGLWLRPSSIDGLDVERRIGNPGLREFVDQYIHIGDLLRITGSPIGVDWCRGAVVRFDYNDRPVVANDGRALTVDRWKILKVKKGAGFSEGDTLRYNPFRDDTQAVRFLDVVDWPRIRVKYGLGAKTISLLDVDRLILPDEPGEKGEPWGTPDDYEWAVGNTVKPATARRQFEIRDVEWGEYAGQQRPQYITTSLDPDVHTAWCDEVIDRWGPVIMV